MEFVWLGIFIILLVIEIFTLGLTTIWFAGGALVAFFATLLGFTWPVPTISFLVVSFILLIFTRPVALKFINEKRAKTNSEGFIGKTAIVTRKVDNDRSEGQVVFNGIEWTARSVDGVVIEADKKVVIQEIDGVKLIVKEDI